MGRKNYIFKKNNPKYYILMIIEIDNIIEYGWI